MQLIFLGSKWREEREAQERFPHLHLKGMTVVKTKRAKKKTRALPVEAEELKAAPGAVVPRTKNCKGYAKRRVEEAWPEIVNSLVESAKEGKYNETKLLVEVSGIKDAKKPAKRKSSGVAKMLLKKLSEKESAHAGDVVAG